VQGTLLDVKDGRFGYCRNNKPTNSHLLQASAVRTEKKKEGFEASKKIRTIIPIHPRSRVSQSSVVLSRRDLQSSPTVAIQGPPNTFRGVGGGVGGEESHSGLVFPAG